ncbi:unnamed protein product [Dovyalis caffra]|uniref:Myb-like domain-containing protein n=1 Tax=Dovyalis caffra TaxID=77055 RepID=A0AAV1SRP7_9ROSI|nr:unnamed protein product [Dovyalis caffra]
MADSEHSSSDETSVDSREETSKESKLEFSEDEETLIIRMFNIVGERLICFVLLWSLIAGWIPGRTAEEIEEYWNTRASSAFVIHKSPLPFCRATATKLAKSTR